MDRTGSDHPRRARAGRAALPVWSRWVLAAVVVLAAVGGVAAWQRTQGPDTDELCRQLAGAAGLDDRLATDPANVATELDALRDAATVAPPEVADDLEVLIVALERLEAAAQRDPADPQGGVQDELLALQDEVDGLETAAQTIGTYARDRCGLTLAGTRTTGTTRPSAADRPPDTAALGTP